MLEHVPLLAFLFVVFVVCWTAAGWPGLDDYPATRGGFVGVALVAGICFALVIGSDLSPANRHSAPPPGPQHLDQTKNQRNTET